MTNHFDDREINGEDKCLGTDEARSDNEPAPPRHRRGDHDEEELSPDEYDPDWPKKTPDTMAAIMAQLAIAPRRLLFLRGSHWHVWLDYKTAVWAADSDDAIETATMLNARFPASTIRESDRSDEAIRVIYDQAVAFLKYAGVTTQVLG